MSKTFNPLVKIGLDESTGTPGPQGDPGVGVPVGGSTGQNLRKIDATNYNTEWHTPVKADVGLGSVDNTSDASKPVSTATQTALDGKVDENTAIVGATKTKITYDTKGLITSGTDATTAEIADSLNKRYVTDAQSTVLGNTSGTNTGDQVIPDQLSDLADDTTHRVVTDTEKSTWNGKVDANTAITGATKTKITYDAKGLVTVGADATNDDILDGTTYKRYSATEQTKLAGIATGAEVNVNADWNAVSGDAQILNKPTVPDTESIQDTVGTMVTGNTETGIAVTYDDINGKLDFDASHNHTGVYAPSSEGVTNGNSHDHSGGDGAQIAHSSLGGIGVNDHHNQAHTITGADHTHSGGTAGRFLRETGATTIGFESVAFSRGGTIYKSDGITATVNVIVWRAPYACTVTGVHGYRVGGSSASVNARKNGSLNHLAADISLASSDTWTTGGVVQNTTYAAGNKLEIMITAVAGSPTQIAIQIDFTRP